MRRANVFSTPRGQKSWDRAMSLISQTEPVKKSYLRLTATIGIVVCAGFVGFLIAVL
jgi:hypothetical protein